MKRKSKPIESKKNQSSRLEFWQVVLVGLIAGASSILVAIINKPTPQTVETRVSIAKLNQDEIDKGFESQKEAARKMKLETDNEQARQILDEFIARTEVNQARHKESSDKFIEKLSSKDETSAEIERRKANNRITANNELASDTQSTLSKLQTNSVVRNKEKDSVAEKKMINFPGTPNIIILCDPKMLCSGVKSSVVPKIEFYNQTKFDENINPKNINDKIARSDITGMEKTKIE